jgi:hypothetical protein
VQRVNGKCCLPIACCAMSAVVLDKCLYALGGSADRLIDNVQKLSLDSLTWELMQLKLPKERHSTCCLKTDTQVYLVIKKTLYSITPYKFKRIKTLRQNISWCITSYYSRGNLYYANSGIWCLAVGEFA